MRFYKSIYKIKQLPSNITSTPGYCIASVYESYDGLYEILSTQFRYPTYLFDIDADIPLFPFDDIVGILTPVNL